MRYVYIFGASAAATLYVLGDVLQTPMYQIRAIFLVAFLAGVAAIDSFYKGK